MPSSRTTSWQIVADDDTDIKHLIGRNGEVVDALQQLTRLLIGLYHMGDSPDTKAVCPAFHVKHRTHT